MNENFFEKGFGDEMSENPERKFLVSLAIPCYNGAATLGAAIGSALSQSRPPEEVIVVDDGSTDGSGKLAQSFPVRYLRHDCRRGVAAARNTAWQEAQGDIIIFIDADAIADPRLVETILSGYQDEEVGGVGGQGIESNIRNSFDRWRKHFWVQTHGPARDDRVWMLMGLCSSFRREALKRVNGFDERLTTNGEDIDVSIRVRAEQYRLVYLPAAKVYHQRSDDFLSLLKMVGRHSYWQARVVRERKASSPPLLTNALKWLFISAGSSLSTHRSLKLALLSPIAGLVSIGAILYADLGKLR